MMSKDLLKEEFDARWHNWKEDPDFWKADMIDVFRKIIDKARKEEREQKHSLTLISKHRNDA